MARHSVPTKRDTWHAFLFLAPFLSAYLILLIYPFVKGVWISLYDWNLLETLFNPDARRFVGLGNYLSMANDPRFWKGLINTVIFVAFSVPTISLMSLGLAILLNRRGHAFALLRPLFFVSQVLSVAVVTLLWQLIFSPRQGIIATTLAYFGLQPYHWTTDPGLAMAALVIATVWWSIGFPLVIFMAALQQVPDERYEAAKLDGAGRWGTLRFITLPSIRRSTTFVVVFQTVLHFQVFGQSHLITRGGPNDASQVLVRYIYQTAFRDSDLGYASALSVFLFVIMLLFTTLQIRLNREESL